VRKASQASAINSDPRVSPRVKVSALSASPAPAKAAKAGK